MAALQADKGIAAYSSRSDCFRYSIEGAVKHRFLGDGRHLETIGIPYDSVTLRHPIQIHDVVDSSSFSRSDIRMILKHLEHKIGWLESRRELLSHEETEACSARRLTYRNISATMQSSLMFESFAPEVLQNIPTVLAAPIEITRFALKGSCIHIGSNVTQEVEEFLLPELDVLLRIYHPLMPENIRSAVADMKLPEQHYILTRMLQGLQRRSTGQVYDVIDLLTCDKFSDSIRSQSINSLWDVYRESFDQHVASEVIRHVKERNKDKSHVNGISIGQRKHELSSATDNEFFMLARERSDQLLQLSDINRLAASPARAASEWSVTTTSEYQEALSTLNMEASPVLPSKSSDARFPHPVDISRAFPRPPAIAMQQCSSEALISRAQNQAVELREPLSENELPLWLTQKAFESAVDAEPKAPVPDEVLWKCNEAVSSANRSDKYSQQRAEPKAVNAASLRISSTGRLSNGVEGPSDVNGQHLAERKGFSSLKRLFRKGKISKSHQGPKDTSVTDDNQGDYDLDEGQQFNAERQDGVHSPSARNVAPEVTVANNEQVSEPLSNTPDWQGDSSNKEQIRQGTPRSSRRPPKTPRDKFYDVITSPISGAVATDVAFGHRNMLSQPPGIPPKIQDPSVLGFHSLRQHEVAIEGRAGSENNS